MKKKIKIILICAAAAVIIFTGLFILKQLLGKKGTEKVYILQIWKPMKILLKSQERLPLRRNRLSRPAVREL